jgi:hypothetical protein
MKKQVCYFNDDECKEKPTYCSYHYERLEKKLSNRNHLVGVLIFGLLGLLLVLPYLSNNIDEDSFCLDKLNRWYPEYNFDKVVYCGTSISSSSNFCITQNEQSCSGKYQENTNLSKRDGLKEINGDLKTKDFALTEQADIDYLGSDNVFGWMCILGLVLLVISGFIVNSWLYN